MKALLLAFALHGGADAGSLGIGMDVLPEAFSFAASRVGYAPHLTLVACDSRRCRWDLGAGVEMTASLTPGTLDVSRIEAEREGGPVTADSSYGKACFAIVALVAPATPAKTQRSMALSIATAAERSRQVRLDMPDAGYSFYGSEQIGTGGTVARCGAAAAPSDIGSKL